MLRRQYRRFERAARERTLVQQESSLWGFILAKVGASAPPAAPCQRCCIGAQVTNRFLLSEHALVEGNGDRERLARAGAHLDQGNLLDAVREVDALSDWAKPAVEPWLKEAKRRALTLQAIDVLKAEVALLPHRVS